MKKKIILLAIILLIAFGLYQPLLSMYHDNSLNKAYLNAKDISELESTRGNQYILVEGEYPRIIEVVIDEFSQEIYYYYYDAKDIKDIHILSDELILEYQDSSLYNVHEKHYITDVVEFDARNVEIFGIGEPNCIVLVIEEKDNDKNDGSWIKVELPKMIDASLILKVVRVKD